MALKRERTVVRATSTIALSLIAVTLLTNCTGDGAGSGRAAAADQNSIGGAAQGCGRTPTDVGRPADLVELTQRRAVALVTDLPLWGPANSSGYSAVGTGLLAGPDACPDVAVGVPERGAGVVLLTEQSELNLRGVAVGDRFGAALAVSGSTLWVGAPGRTVDGMPGAGAVYEYSMAGSHPLLLATITQGAGGVGGTPDSDDGFGSVLAANHFGVLIGAPGDTVDTPKGPAKAAGSVTFYVDRAAHSPFSTMSWTQDSPGVPDTSEAGDRFGASVAADAGGAALLVGVPGEDALGAKDTGVAQLFRAQGSRFVAARLVVQGRQGIPGKAESGDGFGTSVALGRSIFCPESIDGAIGAPGEDVRDLEQDGELQDAGSVTLFSVTSATCPARRLESVWDIHHFVGLGHTLSGAVSDRASSGDLAGAAVAVWIDREPNGQEHDGLMVGIPELNDPTEVLGNDGFDAGGIVVAALKVYAGDHNYLRLVGGAHATGSDYGAVLPVQPG